jgi:hypothetical protein
MAEEAVALADECDRGPTPHWRRRALAHNIFVVTSKKS